MLASIFFDLYRHTLPSKINMETEILSLDKCCTRKISVDYKKGSPKFERKLKEKIATKLSWFNQTLYTVCILLVTICSPNVVKARKSKIIKTVLEEVTLKSVKTKVYHET